jgi:calcineurin-like phosphoesterase family protein
MIWFSSDWHLNHKNITGAKVSSWTGGYRTFDTTNEMNEALISTINKYVKWDDTIYFLGDFCFGGHVKTPYWRSRINCQNIHVIRGNHDENINEYSDSFSSVQDYLELSINAHKFVLMHYAMRTWNGSHKGNIHLYGHTHAGLENIIWGKSMDVGIDNAYRLLGEYRPFSMTEIIDIMNKRKVLEHH